MSDYWIKWFHEILDDPKMATLPDRLWRRFSELCLLTGKLYPDKSGRLPDTRQIAWALRMQSDDLQADLDQLASTNLIQPIPGGWLVTNFEKRQRAASSTERVQQHRERKVKNQYYDNVTGLKRNVTQSREQSTEIETDTEREQGDAPLSDFTPPEIVLVHEVTGLLPDISNEPRIINNIQACRKRMHNPPRDLLLAELTTVYKGWCASKTKDGRPYNPSNWDWTERAATGYTPAPVNGNGRVRMLKGADGQLVEDR